MEVNVKTKYEVHIYIMWALPYMHDNLLKNHTFYWALHTKWYPLSVMHGQTEGRMDGQSGNIMSRRLYRAGHKNILLKHPIYPIYFIKHNLTKTLDFYHTLSLPEMVDQV